MRAPPPDPGHIEQRLQILAEMLDRAVAEVRRVVAEIQGANPPTANGDDTGDTHG